MSPSVMTRPSPATRFSTLRTMELHLGRSVAQTRHALGWSQHELGIRAGVSRSMVAKVESGAGNATIRVVFVLTDALGLHAELRLDAPFLADRVRQREPAHARCIGHARTRLELAGWRTASEVEVRGHRSRGWIDIVAYEPRRRTLQIVEIKTELPDLGALERQVGWYEREAWAVARRLDWPSSRIVSVVMLLMTEANEERLRLNRDELALAFPLRAGDLAARLADPEMSWPPGARGLAMIDPLSRRSAWLRPARIDGRRRAAPYADYAGFMRRVRGRG